MITQAGRLLRILPFASLFLAMGACTQPGDDRAEAPDTGLRFSVSEGQSENHFIRQDGISGHLNLRTHPTPRLIVAFPAGNSGAALFFERAVDDPVWGPVTDIQTIQHQDAAGRTLYGMRADIAIEAEELLLKEADFGSVRFLRKAVNYSKLPPRGMPELTVDGRSLLFYRERPDGASSYHMEVTMLEGRLDTDDGLRFVADDDGRLKIRVVAASGDPLEKPVSADRLLTDDASDNALLENSLAFLSYDDKMLAGSWRFLTYFGRDTLLSLQLLMPVITPEAAEIGLRSVLERTNDHGEVAHEEEIGELAVYRNIAEHDQASADPIYDYDMIDDNLMLAPVLVSYIETFGVDRAQKFLSGNAKTQEPLRAKLNKNLKLVVRQASAFANEPVRSNLIPIKDGLNDGNWRDSEEGLAGGRYPYDVNAVLVPAALQAVADIVGSGLLGEYGDALPSQSELIGMAAVWHENSAGFFRVSVNAKKAQAMVADYADKNGFPLSDIATHGVNIYGVALDRDLRPLPVMHTDTGFDLLFLDRPEQDIRGIVANLSGVFQPDWRRP